MHNKVADTHTYFKKKKMWGCLDNFSDLHFAGRYLLCRYNVAIAKGLLWMNLVLINDFVWKQYIHKARNDFLMMQIFYNLYWISKAVVATAPASWKVISLMPSRRYTSHSRHKKIFASELKSSEYWSQFHYQQNICSSRWKDSFITLAISKISSLL